MYIKMLHASLKDIAYFKNIVSLIRFVLSVSNVFISVLSSLEDMADKEQDDMCSIYPVRQLKEKPCYLFTITINFPSKVTCSTLFKGTTPLE